MQQTKRLMALMLSGAMAVSGLSSAALAAETAEWQMPSLVTDHRTYVSGYEDGTFQPDGKLTKAEAATLLYNLLDDQTAGPYAGNYTDVTDDAWYYGAVSTLVSMQILDGGGSYAPNTEITRGQFADMVSRLVPASGTSVSFSDITSESPYYSAVVTCVSNGWIAGYEDNTFRADGSLSRAEAVTILNRVMNRNADITVLGTGNNAYQRFSDVLSDAWYYSAVMEAAVEHTAQMDSAQKENWLDWLSATSVTYYYNGGSAVESVAIGTTPTAVPQTNAQGQTITRWIDNSTGAFVNPSAVIAQQGVNPQYTAWYAPEMKDGHRKYISGYGDGNFGPDDTLTRAQAAQLVYNLLQDTAIGTYRSDYYDVSGDAWYYDAITVLASRKLFDCDGGAFRPEEQMTRGEFVDLIARMSSLSGGSISFSDVKTTDVYYQAIMVCAGQGWIAGYPDGTFHAENNLTRAESVTILNRMQNRYGDTAAANQLTAYQKFNDVSQAHWAYTAIMEAATAHFYTMNGTIETWTNTYNVKFQTEEAFKNIKYGWNSVYNSACGPASAANAMYAAGIADVDLLSMCDFAVNCGARVSTGTDERVLLNALSAAYGFRYTTTSSDDALLAHLRAGNVAIIHAGSSYSLFTSSGHYMAAVGAEGNNVIIEDSYWYDGKYTQNEMRRQNTTIIDKGVVSADIAQVGKACSDRSPRYYLIYA